MGWMNDVFKVFLSLSLSGSLIILLMFFCGRFWKDRISRQWQYYIWLIVLARLLLPFTPEQNLMGYMFQNIDRMMIQAYTVSPPPTESSLQDMDYESSTYRKSDRSRENQPFLQAADEQPVQDISALLAGKLWLVWLVTAFVLLMRKITIYQSFVRYVKAGQTLVSDIALLDRLSVLAGQTGIKKPVELCVNPLISSPLLVGFSRPCIVLPDTDISEKDFRYTVMHELTHYRRRDMFYKWLVQVVVCLHWFNPLVYLMSRKINKACEFSCDEAIIARLDSGSAQEYGRTLLNAMVKAGSYKESLASVTLNENKEMLKERLGAIMRFKKKSKLKTAFSTLLTVTLLCSTVFTGAYAAVPDNIVLDTATENTGDTVVINLSNNKDQKSIIHSSSFEASDGQVLTLEIESTITGTVDLFLFSPTFQEQRITIGSGNDTKTIDLSKGTWAYNCTGFFDSGTISIIGTVK